MGPTLGPSGGPFWSPPSRKLRRVNESVDGYEPGGRTFESCWAHQINNLQPLFCRAGTSCEQFVRDSAAHAASCDAAVFESGRFLNEAPLQVGEHLV